MTNRCAGFYAFAYRALRSYGAIALSVSVLNRGAGVKTLGFAAAGGPISLVANARGPLFYNPREDATPDDPTKPWRARSVTVVNRLATWVRALGVTDKEIQPNHAWRHTFKARALRFGMREHIVDAVCGHAPASVGRSYSTPTLADKAVEVRKFPRYEFDGSGRVGQVRVGPTTEVAVLTQSRGQQSQETAE
jgi:integrase